MLSYQTIGACTIKRKKPWKEVVWAGIQNESLLLVDRSRCSVLYMKDGKTQKRINPIQQYISACRLIKVTAQGEHVYGLMTSGDVFVWNKDKNTVFIINGVANLKSNDSEEKVHLELSSTADKLLVITNCTQYFVWRRSSTWTETKNKKTQTISGMWYRIDCSSTVLLPEVYCKESTCDSVYLNNHMLGDCILSSSVFFDPGEETRLSTVLLSFNTDLITNSSAPRASWMSLRLPKPNSNIQLQRSQGAMIIKYSNNHTICALALNQRQVTDTRLLFICPLTQSVVNSELSYLGVSKERAGRHYWISDMCWNSADTILYMVTKFGTVTALTRLGEPLYISTEGHGVNFTHEKYLPILPKISIRPKAQENIPPADDTSLLSDQSAMRQRYSVSAHSRLPLLIVSDGFQVVVLQLKTESNEKSLSVTYLSTAISTLKLLYKNISLSTADLSRIDSVSHRQRHLIDASRAADQSGYQFEDSVELDESLSLASSATDVLRVVEDGTMISFASALVRKSQTLAMSEDTHHREQQVIKNLSFAWALLTSCYRWSYDLENVAIAITSCFNKLIQHKLEQSAQQSSKGMYSSVLGRLCNIIIQLVEMIKFDSFNHHMAPVTIKWVKSVVDILIMTSSSSIKQRMMTAKWSLILVQATESALISSYSWSPSNRYNTESNNQNKTSHTVTFEYLDPPYTIMKSEPHITDEQTGSDNERFNQSETGAQSETISEKISHKNMVLCTNYENLPCRRLLPVYRSIIKYLTALYSSCLVNKSPEKITKLVTNLLSSSQLIIQRSAAFISPNNLKLNRYCVSGDLSYLKGLRSIAVEEWANAITQSNGGLHMRTKLLHAILYTQLIQADISSSVMFIERLVAQTIDEPSIRQSFISKDKAYLSSIRVIGDRSVRRVVQTLSRFMCRYFTDTHLYVYTPHDPRPLHSLHDDIIPDEGIVGIDRNLISDKITRFKLSEIFSLNTTVRYMLISGLFSELVWFVYKMGDWRTATGLSLSITKFDELVSKHCKKSSVHTILPESLKPAAVIEDMMSSYLNQPTVPTSSVDQRDRSAAVYDVMLPAALFSVPILPQIITDLWMRVKSTASRCLPFVPTEVYLPAPVLFCTQDISLHQVDPDSDTYTELSWRLELSPLIINLISLLTCTHTELSCCGWLLRKLSSVWKSEKAKNIIKDLELRIPESLDEYLTYHMSEKEKSNKPILIIFRNLCTLLWILHVRDEVSIHLHQSADIALKRQNTRVSSSLVEQHKWYTHIEDTLDWCLLYFPASNYLNCQTEICEAIMSLCENLPPTDRLVEKVASCIYDIESLAPELKEKMDSLLKLWQNTQSEHDNSKSLSIYYFTCCDLTEQSLEQRSTSLPFEEQVFTTPKATKMVGSRLHEYDVSYLQFLDLFFSVSFRGSLPERGVARPIPLVPSSSQSLQQLHFTKLIADRIERSNNITSDQQVDLPDHPLLTDMDIDIELYKRDEFCGLYKSKRFKSHENLRASLRSGTSLRSLRRRSLSEGNLYEVSLTTSEQLLPQNVHLSEKYQKLYNQYTWLENWAQQSTSNIRLDNQSMSKMKVCRDDLITAMLMCEKLIYYKQRKIVFPTRKLQPSASLKYEEDDVDRSAVLEEMKKQAALPIATQPINRLDTIKSQTGSINQTLQSMANLTAKQETRQSSDFESQTQPGLTDPYMLDDSATTVWSSATLPHLSIDKDDPTIIADGEKDWRTSPDPGVLSPVSSRHSRRSQSNNVSRATSETAVSGISADTLNMRSEADTSAWHTQSSRHSKRGKLRTVHPSEREDNSIHKQAELHAQKALGSEMSQQMMASQLQSIIREEMRKIVQVQHASISQMLGALGGSELPNLPVQSIPGSRPEVQRSNERSSERSNRSLKVEDLNYTQRAEGVNLPELFTEVQNLKRGRYKQPNSDKRQPDSVKIPLLSVRPAWSAPHQIPDRPEDVETPVLSGRQVKDIREGRKAGIPLLQLEESHQDNGSIPLLHVHEDIPNIFPDPQPAFGAEQLIQYDQKQNRKQQLKQQIINRFSDTQKQLRAEQMRQNMERQLLKVDYNQIDEREVVRTGPDDMREVKRTAEKKKKSKRKQEKTATDGSQRDTSQIDDLSEIIQVKPAADLMETKQVEEEAVEREKSPEEVKVREQGYALTPGLYDEYLEKAVELGDPISGQFASSQYKAATGVQVQMPRVADVGMMTDNQTVDRGVGPVSDLFTHQPMITRDIPILAPNIFNQLTFSGVDMVTDPITQRSDTRGRGYLSVINVGDNSTKNLPLQDHTTPNKQEKQTEESDEQVNMFADVQYNAAMEIAGDNRPVIRTSQYETATDFITKELMSVRHDPADFVMPPKRRLNLKFRDAAKNDMAERIMAMDDQLQAIEMMKENMDQQMKDTRLLVGAAYATAENQAAVAPLQPSQVARLIEGEGHVAILRAQEENPEEELVADTMVAPGEEEEELRSSTHMTVSGLSDISNVYEIVDSMVKKGEVSLKDLGIERTTPKTLKAAQPNLTNKPHLKSSMEKAVQSSRSKLEEKIDALITSRSEAKMSKPHVPGTKQQRDPEQMKAWRKEHEKEVSSRFKMEVEQQKRPEIQPYQPDPQSKTMSRREISEHEKQRESKRQELIHEGYNKRLQEASQLLEGIIEQRAVTERVTRHDETFIKSPHPQRKVGGATYRQLATPRYNIASARSVRDKYATTSGIYLPEQERRKLEKIYGTKRIPGIYQTYKPESRQTKTYAERLKETIPPKYRQAHSRTMQQVTRRGIKSGRPAHAVKTYTQQLQDIQERAPRTARSGQAYKSGEIGGPVRLRSPPNRSRPYNDPYSLTARSDITNEDVKRIMGTAYQQYLDADDMTIGDDISDLSSLAAAGIALMAAQDADRYSGRGVSEGAPSEASAIDWEYVDKLIADVSDTASGVSGY